MDVDKRVQEVRIRPLQRQDIQMVYLINKENFTTDAWTLEGFERELSLDYSRSYVMEMGGQVVGYAVVWIIHDEAHIMTLGIKKDLWGRGLGRKLLVWIIEDLRQSVSRFLLDVRVSNLRAIKLYKDMGFKILSLRYRYYSDGENAYQMCLELSDGDKGQEAKEGYISPRDS